MSVMHISAWEATRNQQASPIYKHHPILTKPAQRDNLKKVCVIQKEQIWLLHSTELLHIVTVHRCRMTVGVCRCVEELDAALFTNGCSQVS